MVRPRVPSGVVLLPVAVRSREVFSKPRNNLFPYLPTQVILFSLA